MTPALTGPRTLFCVSAESWIQVPSPLQAKSFCPFYSSSPCLPSSYRSLLLVSLWEAHSEDWKCLPLPQGQMTFASTAPWETDFTWALGGGNVPCPSHATSSFCSNLVPGSSHLAFENSLKLKLFFFFFFLFSLPAFMVANSSSRALATMTVMCPFLLWGAWSHLCFVGAV